MAARLKNVARGARAKFNRALKSGQLRFTERQLQSTLNKVFQSVIDQARKNGQVDEAAVKAMEATTKTMQEFEAAQQENTTTLNRIAKTIDNMGRSTKSRRARGGG